MYTDILNLLVEFDAKSNQKTGKIVDQLPRVCYVLYVCILCVYVCVYVCIRAVCVYLVCVCVCLCVYTCVCVCVCVCVCACVCVCMCDIRMYIYVCVYTHVYMCLWVYSCVHVTHMYQHRSLWLVIRVQGRQASWRWSPMHEFSQGKPTSVNYVKAVSTITTHL